MKHQNCYVPYHKCRLLCKINQHILFHKKGSNSIVELVNSSLPLRKDLIVEVLTVGSLHPPQVCSVSQNSLVKPYWLLWFFKSCTIFIRNNHIHSSITATSYQKQVMTATTGKPCHAGRIVIKYVKVNNIVCRCAFTSLRDSKSKKNFAHIWVQGNDHIHFTVYLIRGAKYSLFFA